MIFTLRLTERGALLVCEACGEEFDETTGVRWLELDPLRRHAMLHGAPRCTSTDSEHQCVDYAGHWDMHNNGRTRWSP